MMVSDRAIGMMFFAALRAMDLVRREVLRTIESQQVVAVEKAELLQCPVALQGGKEIAKGGPELFVVEQIERLSQGGVGRHVFHVKDHLQVFLVLLSALVERGSSVESV